MGIPTGSCSVFDGINGQGNGNLDNTGSGSVTFTPNSTGQHSIVADYNGDTNDQPSQSQPVILQVNPPASSTTTTITGITPNPVVVGQPVTVTFQVTNP